MVAAVLAVSGCFQVKLKDDQREKGGSHVSRELSWKARLRPLTHWSAHVINGQRHASDWSMATYPTEWVPGGLYCKADVVASVIS